MSAPLDTELSAPAVDAEAEAIEHLAVRARVLANAVRRGDDDGCWPRTPGTEDKRKRLVESMAAVLDEFGLISEGHALQEAAASMCRLGEANP